MHGSEGGGDDGRGSADPEHKETSVLQGHLVMVVGDNIAKVPSCFVVDVKACDVIIYLSNLQVWGLFAPKYVAAGAAPTPSSLL